MPAQPSPSPADIPAVAMAVTFPPELPISQALDELSAAISAHQVVVVAGETGSGKTTQLPKLCLALGRGVTGRIGHTQPRRLAARTVADRIAEELGVQLGAEVGYQVRFTDRTAGGTRVKLMTDGILLAEIQRDRDLAAYDTIILDEAHERSLNVDFLLGYLKQLLPRRPDLKLLITSATIDPDRFARHFDAPVVRVSGRTFPVEVRYRPLEDAQQPESEPRDQIQGICDAVMELSREAAGDVLVFCSGEREIRDTADALSSLSLRDTEVLPLYARLSVAEQQRVWQPHRGRRVVLATNIAETSLTVPGIRYVVDPGTARISRYSTRLKVQRLPIEPVSQASADQRKGRCGRVAPGICIRLYSEEDFASRPAFTDPEILRTDLAAVLLQMTALGLGEVARFPFLDPPEHRSVRDAVRLLHELGAVRSDDASVAPRLTKVGRTLARLPVDPRFGRMLIEAHRGGCLREVLVIVAALSIQDPRERPADQRAAADEQHARFVEPGSDLLSYLNLWRYVMSQQRELSSSAFRRRCRGEFLHFLRIREWQDLHAQLRAVVKELGMAPARGGQPAGPDAVHRALLAGLLSHVGMRQADSRDYLGARGARFAVWPGSSLVRSRPSWVMAAELVETTRLWARDVARIDPGWVEQLAGHLVHRQHSEPRWDARRGGAVATERVTLYGLPLVAGRTVALTPIDPEVARELFLRCALVDGRWRTAHAFFARNRQVLTDLAALEDKVRRRDLVDDEALLRFYDQRVPADVTSVRAFDAWWRTIGAEQPDLLTVSPDQLLPPGLAQRIGRLQQGFPDAVTAGDVALPVTYRFSPGAQDDGVTISLPLALLPRLGPVGFDWQVPGMRAELVVALLRALPKDLRRQLVPVPDTAAALLQELRPDGRPLSEALSALIRRRTGVVVPPTALSAAAVPDHVRVGFRVTDGDRVVGYGRDLPVLQAQLASAVRGAVADTADDLEGSGLRAWPGALPQMVARRRDGHEVRGFPALVDEGASVGVRVLPSAREQQEAMTAGLRRLLLLELPPPARAVHAALSHHDKLLLATSPHGGVSALLEDCTAAAVDALVGTAGGPVRDAEAYAALRAVVASGMTDAVLAILRDVVAVLQAAQGVRRRLERPGAPGATDAGEDVRAQMDRLLGPGFVSIAGRERLPDVVRYLEAAAHRLDKAGSDPAGDRAHQDRVAAVEDSYEALRRRGTAGAGDLRRLGWSIEELRVSLFAQHLGTRERVSEQRIYRAIVDMSATAAP